MAEKQANVVLHAQRMANLRTRAEARLARAASEVRALENQITGVNVGREQDDADDQREEDRYSTQRATEIDDELTAELEPMVIARLDEPSHKIAAAFGVAYLKYDKLLMDNLGEHLWPTRIVLEFGKQLIATRPEAVNVLAHSQGRLAELAGPLARLAAMAGPGAKSIECTPAVDQALTTMVIGLHELVASTSGPANEGNRARFALICASPTYTLAYKKLAAYAEQAERAAPAASYEPVVPREPFRDRARKVLGALGI